jgi:hypothetical protein
MAAAPRTADTAPTPVPATDAPPEDLAKAREASAAYQAARPERRVNPAIAAADERQTRVMPELSRREFLEHGDGASEGSQPLRGKKTRQSSHQVTCRRAPGSMMLRQHS